MHGYDIAYALGMPWPIDPGHAVLILGAYGPLFPHIVDAETAAAEAMLAVFMGSILIVWMLEVSDHVGVLHHHAQTG